MRFGVNYVPSKNWWYSWNDWDPSGIEKDLKAISLIGFDHIRIHCLWDSFQPNRRFVSPTLLEHLKELLDLADSYGLDVEIAPLDGWLSGFFFLPAWVKDSLVSPGDLMDGIRYYYQKLTEKIGDHPRFMGYDLGNELSVFCVVHKAFSTEQGDRWQKEIFSFLEKIAPGKLHTNGVDHTPWFGNIAFSREQLSRLGAVTSVHCWSAFTGAMEKYGVLGTGSVHICDYMVELAKAYTDRPVWVQELGASEYWMSKEQMPVFIQKTFENLFSCGGVWGVTWWCSHDINRKFADFHPLELDLGLLDTNNQLKPAGELIQKVIRQYKEGKFQSSPYDCEIYFGEEDFSDLPSSGWNVGEKYMDAAALGKHPRLIRK